MRRVDNICVSWWRWQRIYALGVARERSVCGEHFVYGWISLIFLKNLMGILYGGGLIASWLQSHY